MTQSLTRVEPLSCHLSVDLQLSSAGSAGVDGEISRFVDDAAGPVQTGPEAFHLFTFKTSGFT